MSDVLLIHPSYHTAGIGKDNIHAKESLTPSLGLAHIAAYLEKNNIDVQIIDLRLERINSDEFVNKLKEEKPLVVGLTAFTDEIVAAASIARIVKKHDRKILTAVGGPHPTAIPINTLREFADFDAVVIGEGEISFYELVEATLNGTSLSKIKGLAIRSDGVPKLTESRSTIQDLDSLPFPAWHLFDLEKYSDIFMVSSSRGCPFQCYFCFRQYLGNTRLRYVKNVVDEIEYDIINFGATEIQFADATLSLIRDRAMELCDVLIEKGLNKKIKWHCETRADRVDIELLNRFKEAGCKSVSFGIESGDETLLKEVIKKGETKEQMKRAVNMAKSVGIETRCFFIIGHAFETRETIQRTIDFAKELSPDALSFGIMVPYPGSELRRLAENKVGGLNILHNDWSMYNQINYDCMELDEIPLDELKRWQSRAYIQYYSTRPLKFIKLLSGAQGYTLRSIPEIIAHGLRSLIG